MEHPGQDDVVDVVAAAADEPLVLLALDRVADAADLFGGRHLYLPEASLVDAVTKGARFIRAPDSLLRPRAGPP